MNFFPIIVAAYDTDTDKADRPPDSQAKSET
jgi:hypothetical protein